jgi:hypothetical protein
MFRRLLQSLALVLVVAAPSMVQAASIAPVAEVASIQSNRVADLVLLSDGFNAGLRQGMVCRITRGTTEIAEVLLVDLRPACSAALILSVASRQSIRAGDLASIKVLKS